jgi:glyceraldehyde-3-phosphate dehydrogenase (NADP+)
MLGRVTRSGGFPYGKQALSKERNVLDTLHDAPAPTHSASAQLDALFPDAQGIPADYAAVLPCQCREYLVDGELRPWGGPVQEVVSPVLARQNGELTPVRLGYCPVLDAEAALLGLDAACRAYGAGRGQWPMLPATARLEAVRAFTRQLGAKR